MGRYYSGDIEGKFMVGQKVDCLVRFGGYFTVPTFVDYTFLKEDLEILEEEIMHSVRALGPKKKIIADYQIENDGRWNFEELAKKGVSHADVLAFFDLDMAFKVRDCVQKTGKCEFRAETN